MLKTQEESRGFTVGPFVFWGALWGALICVIELLAVSAGIRATVAGCCLGLVGGGAIGLLIGGLCCGLRAASKSSLLVRAFWILPGAIAASWIFTSLNITGHLGDKQFALAQKAALGCLLLAILIAAWGALLQPTQTKPMGLLGHRRPLRLIFGALLIASAGIAFYLDAHLLVGLYLDVHLLLRTLGLAVGCSGFVLLCPHFRLRYGRICTGLISGGILVSAWLCTASHQGALWSLIQAPLPSSLLQSVRISTDFDFDGASSLWGGGDCAPFNAAIHPRAREIPNDGLDNNCIRGDYVPKPAAKAPISLSPAEDADQTSVVLITIDATRPDHMSVYGYDRETTPNLKRFAQNARVYKRAYTSGAMTSLAIPSLLRGIYPRRILWKKLYETDQYELLTEEEVNANSKVHVIHMAEIPADDSRPVLTEILRNNSVYTIAVLDDSEGELFDPRFGYNKGFSQYDRVKSSRGDAETIDRAIAQLSKRPQSQRFFLWIHLSGPHWLNVIRKDVEQFGKSLMDQYDHALLYADMQINRFLNELERLENYEHLKIVVAADHGEHFGKAWHYHGTDVSEEQIRIPLIVKSHDLPAEEASELVSLIDLFPTILHWFGIECPANIDAIPLQMMPKKRSLISEAVLISVDKPLAIDRIAAFDGVHKLVIDRASFGKSLTYQLDSDDSSNLYGIIRSDLLDDVIEQYIEETSGVIRYDE